MHGVLAERVARDEPREAPEVPLGGPQFADAMCLAESGEKMRGCVTTAMNL
ncbi:MAG: hypothetical protein P8R42_13595 [Candidatus Binatia bacterium]|nr:hypothetical protein [Candidatus Binatia bacterium]